MSRLQAVPCRRSEVSAQVTVPLTVLDLLELDPVRYAAAGSALRQIGACLEVDVGALDLVADGLGERCTDFYLHARRLWESGVVSPGDGAVHVRVPLVERRQSDSKAGRTDLSAELAAMERMPVLRTALGVLDAVPNWDVLSAIGEVSRADDRATLAMELQGTHWPLELGGPPAPGEVSRRLQLDVSYAAWRDRRVRRLLQLRVDSLELWPDPAPYRTN